MAQAPAFLAAPHFSIRRAPRTAATPGRPSHGPPPPPPPPPPPRALSRGPGTPAPDYTRIDAFPPNRLLTAVFRSKLEAELGRRARAPGYAGVIETVRALADQHRDDPRALRAASQRVLASLFPRWLPPAFAALFSRNVPAFAAWINAAVTVAVTQWLMGESRVAEGGMVVEIDRCRYLEETGCVGICLNSCKAATEGFFQSNMGIAVAIEPNLDDYSCKFHFGKHPLPEPEDPMYQQPCFASCPMRSTTTPGPVCDSVTPHNAA